MKRQIADFLIATFIGIILSVLVITSATFFITGSVKDYSLIEVKCNK